MSLEDSLSFVKGGLKSAVFFTVGTWGIHYASGRVHLNHLHNTQGRDVAVETAEAKLENYGDNLFIDFALLGWNGAPSDYLRSQGIYKSR